MATKEIQVPDIGDFDDVQVIEVLVSLGDDVQPEDSLITLESEKASMEIPSPDAGKVLELKVAVGDRLSRGDPIVVLELNGDAGSKVATPAAPAAAEPAPASPPAAARDAEASRPGAAPTAASGSPTRTRRVPGFRPSPTAQIDEVEFVRAHASPSVRKFARELGVNLPEVEGTGRKGRILREDVKVWVKRALSQPAGSGLGVPPMPEIDFSEWGEVETEPLSKIKRLTGRNLHRNWVTVPHVTQFDEADITALEEFRRSMGEEYAEKGIKITLLSFLMKAVISALREYPHFNSSLDPSGEKLILKKYFHIGVAVHTQEGLVVPVIRDVDRKSLVELAVELREVSQRARAKKLMPSDMQGGCFSISSLGGVGGTQFTPIINAPEVAILGVSRARKQPVWNGKEFEPRLILPMSLSYDHRVIDGVDGARFTTLLSLMLSDTRRLLL